MSPSGSQCPGTRQRTAPSQRQLEYSPPGDEAADAFAGVEEEVVHQPPFPSWADVFYLAAYPFLLLGILLLPARPLAGIARTRIALDGLMIMAAVVTVSWYFVLGPTVLQGGETLLGKVVSTAYPTIDLALLTCVFALWSRAGSRALQPVALLLTAGLLCVVVADSVFDYQGLQGTYAVGEAIDPLWSLGYLLIGLGAWMARQAPAGTMATDSEGAPGAEGAASPAWYALAPYAALPIVAALLLFMGRVRGDGSRALGVYIGAAALVALVALRQILVILENRRLYARLDQAYAAQARDLAQRERQVQTVVSSAPLVLFALDQNGVYTLAEGTALATMGLRPEALLGRSIFALFPGAADIHACVRRALAGEACAGRIDRDGPGDVGVVLDAQYKPLRDADGTVAGIIGVAVDVTERAHAEAARRCSEERHRALSAHATDLVQVLDAQGVIRCASPSHRPLLGYTPAEVEGLLLDLDRFKEVNDALGHQYGDELLRQAGARLRETLRASDTVARLGGDEFAALLPGEAAAVGVARAMLAALATPIVVEGLPLDVGASVGVALSPAHGGDAATLLRRADVAMYAAKRAQRLRRVQRRRRPAQRRPPRPGRRPASGPRRRRTPAALSAPGLPRHGHDPRRRGAAALAPPHARLHPARRVYPAR